MAIYLRSIEDTCTATGLGRTKVHELITDRRLDAKKCGRRTLITDESIRRLVESLPDAKINVKSRWSALPGVNLGERRGDAACGQRASENIGLKADRSAKGRKGKAAGREAS